MAASLIDTMTEDFEPDQYHDAYREALEAVVQAKVEGNQIARPASQETEPKAAPADLSEILRASVAALKAQRDGAERAGSDGTAAKKPASRKKRSA
jgi:DNA end-binding protein Ku